MVETIHSTRSYIPVLVWWLKRFKNPNLMSPTSTSLFTTLQKILIAGGRGDSLYRTLLCNHNAQTAHSRWPSRLSSRPSSWLQVCRQSSPWKAETVPSFAHPEGPDLFPTHTKRSINFYDGLNKLCFLFFFLALQFLALPKTQRVSPTPKRSDLH